MAEPVLFNQPAYLDRWKSSWSSRYSALSKTPLVAEDDWKNLAKYDLQRVMQGQQPLSDREAALGLMALRSGQQVIPEPQQDDSIGDWLVGNPLRDLRDILTGLPKLPGVLINEARQLPNAPAVIGRALHTEGDIGDRVAALTEAPGVRLVPGSYTIHNIAAGTPEELARHPVSTLLDVLPYAEKAGVTAAAKTAAQPLLERSGRFFQERGLGGQVARDTMRAASQAERGLSRAQVGIQRTILSKFDELGLTPEEGQRYMQWAELERQRGVPAPDPRFDELAAFQDQLNSTTTPLGERTGNLVEFEGELYSGQSRMGRLLRLHNKRIGTLLDQVDRQLKKERHWNERVEGDQLQLNNLLNGGYDAGQLGTQLDSLARRWTQERGPEIIGQFESQAPSAPGGAPLPLRPGEVAWGEGVRNNAAQPVARQVIPKSYKDVRIENGRIRSGAIDTLEERMAANQAAYVQAEQAVMANQGRIEFEEPARAQLERDVASTKERLKAHDSVLAAIRSGEGELAALHRRANTVRFDPQLNDLLDRASQGLTGEVANRFYKLWGDAETNPAAAEQLLEELRQPGRFPGDSRQAADRAAQSLRVRVNDAKAAQASLRRNPGFLSDEELVAARESLTRDESRLAALTDRVRASTDLSAELEKLRVERQKLGKAYLKEANRLQKVSTKIREEVGLDPNEEMLRRAYDAMDAYDAGDKMFVRALGERPAGQGVRNIDQVRAIAQQLEEQGWTAPPPKEKLASIKRTTQAGKAYRNTPEVARLTKARRSMDRLFGTYGFVYQVQGAISAGDIAQATKLASKMVGEARNLAKVVPEAEQLVGQLTDIRKDIPRLPSRARKIEHHMARLETNRARAAQITGRIDELTTQLDKLAKSRGKLVMDEPPARFIPKLNQMMREEVYARFNPTNDPDVGMRLQMGAWRDLMPEKEIDELYRSYARHWQELREQGFDPVWTHHVPPQKSNQVTRTSLALDHEPTPGQVRNRAMDMGDHIDAPEVAMTHQLLEWEQRNWTENFLWGGEGLPGVMSNIDDGGMAWTREQVIDKYADEVVAFARKHNLSIEQATDRFITRHFTTLDPFQFISWKPTAKIRGLGRTQELARVNGTVQEVPKTVLVPKATEKVITGMIPRQGGPGFAYTIYNKAMNVFRVSALAFAPRFQLYNTLGGAIMLTARTDPGVFRYWSQAKDLVGSFGDFVRRGEPSKMPLPISSGGAVVPEFATRLRTDPVAAVRFEQGKWYGKLWSGVERAAEKSFSMNEWVDNMYRSMAYLYGTDKSLTKGLSKAEAQAEGARLANTILQDWDTMLPWERTVLRNVLPFYGWMKHIARYTFTYPFDHPLRASILSAMVRTELEDQKTGLPDRFRQIMWLGEPAADGSQWTINLAGANPFADVADMFTLAGFISQVSPAGQSVLEMMGVDLANARSSLYPDTTYNPETGRLVAVGKSPIESAITSFVPQAEAVYGLGSLSRDMRMLAQRDPDAWKSRIFNSLGVPFAPRRRSMTEEQIRAELARDQAAADALRQAIKTGEWGQALRYPVAMIDVNGDRQVEAVSPERVKQLIETAQGG